MEAETQNNQLTATQSFEMSPTIGKLADALAKAQAEIKGAPKSSENPFYKSKYADLETCIEAARPHLTKNGLALTQWPVEGEEGRVRLMSLLLHSSGEWMKGVFSMKPTKPDPQGEGSALTYARRYTYSAITGVAQADDDGNAASGEAKPTKSHDKATKPFRFDGKLVSDVKVVDTECFVKVKNGLGEFVLGAADPISSKMLELKAGTDFSCIAADTGQKKNNLPLYQVRKYPVGASEAPEAA